MLFWASETTSPLPAILWGDVMSDPGKLPVLVPLDDLLALYRAANEQQEYNQELQRLRREIDGLRSLYQESLVLLSDIRRQTRTK